MLRLIYPYFFLYSAWIIRREFVSNSSSRMDISQSINSSNNLYEKKRIKNTLKTADFEPNDALFLLHNPISRCCRTILQQRVDYLLEGQMQLTILLTDWSRLRKNHPSYCVQRRPTPKRIKAICSEHQHRCWTRMRAFQTAGYLTLIVPSHEPVTKTPGLLGWEWNWTDVTGAWCPESFSSSFPV